MHKTTHYFIIITVSFFTKISMISFYVPPGSRDGSNLVAPKKGEQEFDDVLSDFAQYGRIQFWDDRYMRDQEPFEWFVSKPYWCITVLPCF